MSFLCSCAGRRRKRSESDDRQEYYRRRSRSASKTPPLGPAPTAATPKVKRKFPTGITANPSVPSDLEENSSAAVAAKKATKTTAAKAPKNKDATKPKAATDKFKDTAKVQFESKVAPGSAVRTTPLPEKRTQGTMTAPGAGEVTGYEQTILPRTRKKSPPVVAARMEVKLKSTRRPDPIAMATHCDDGIGSSGSDTPRGYEASVSSSDAGSGSPRDAQTQCAFSDFSDDESSLLSLGREEGEYENTVSELRDPSTNPGGSGPDVWDPAFLQHDSIWMDIKSTLMDLISDKDSPAFQDLQESMKPPDLTYCTVFRKMDGSVTHKAREDSKRTVRHSFGGVPADKVQGSRGKLNLVALRDRSDQDDLDWSERNEQRRRARERDHADEMDYEDCWTPGSEFDDKLFTPDAEVTEYYFGRRTSLEPEEAGLPTTARKTPDVEITEFYFGKSASPEKSLPTFRSESQITLRSFSASRSSEALRASMSAIWPPPAPRAEKFGGSARELKSVPRESRISESLRSSLTAIWPGGSTSRDEKKVGGSAGELKTTKEPREGSVVKGDSAVCDETEERFKDEGEIKREEPESSTNVTENEQETSRVDEKMNEELIRKSEDNKGKETCVEAVTTVLPTPLGEKTKSEVNVEQFSGVKMRHKGGSRSFDRSVSESSTRVVREGTPITHDLKAQKELWRQGIALEAKDLDLGGNLDLGDAELEGMEVEPVAAETHEKNRQHPKRVTRRKETSALRSFSLDYEKRSPKVARKRPGKPVVSVPYASARPSHLPVRDHSKHKLKVKSEDRIEDESQVPTGPVPDVSVPVSTGPVLDDSCPVPTGSLPDHSSPVSIRPVPDDSSPATSSIPKGADRVSVAQPADVTLPEKAKLSPESNAEFDAENNRICGDVIEDSSGLRSPGVVRSIIAGRFTVESKPTDVYEFPGCATETERVDSNLKAEKEQKESVSKLSSRKDSESNVKEGKIEKAKKPVDASSKQANSLSKVKHSFLPEIDAESRFVSKPSEVKRSGKIELISPPSEDEENEEKKTRRTKKTRNVGRFLPRGGVAAKDIRTEDAIHSDKMSHETASVAEESARENISREVVESIGVKEDSDDVSRKSEELQRQVSVASTTEPDLVTTHGSPHSSVDDQFLKMGNSGEDSMSKGGPDVIVQCFSDFAICSEKEKHLEPLVDISVLDDGKKKKERSLGKHSTAFSDASTSVETVISVSTITQSTDDVSSTNLDEIQPRTQSEEVPGKTEEKVVVSNEDGAKGSVVQDDTNISANSNANRDDFVLDSKNVNVQIESEKSAPTFKATVDEKRESDISFLDSPVSLSETVDNKIHDTLDTLATKNARIDISQEIMDIPSKVTTELGVTSKEAKPKDVPEDIQVDKEQPRSVETSRPSDICEAVGALIDLSVSETTDKSTEGKFPESSSSIASVRSSRELKDASHPGSSASSPKRTSYSDTFHPLPKVETTVDQTPLGTPGIRDTSVVENTAPSRTPRVRLSDIVITGSVEEKIIALSKSESSHAIESEHKIEKPNEVRSEVAKTEIDSFAADSQQHKEVDSKIDQQTTSLTVDVKIIPPAIADTSSTSDRIDVPTSETTKGLPPPLPSIDFETDEKVPARTILSSPTIEDDLNSSSIRSSSGAVVATEQEQPTTEEVLGSLPEHRDSFLSTVCDTKSWTPPDKSFDVNKTSSGIIDKKSETEIKKIEETTDDVQKTEDKSDENNEKVAKAEKKPVKVKKGEKKEIKSDKKEKTKKSSKGDGKAVKTDLKSFPPTDRPIRIAVRPSTKMRALASSTPSASPVSATPTSGSPETVESSTDPVSKREEAISEDLPLPKPETTSKALVLETATMPSIIHGVKDRVKELKDQDSESGIVVQGPVEQASEVGIQPSLRIELLPEDGNVDVKIVQQHSVLDEYSILKSESDAIETVDTIVSEKTSPDRDSLERDVPKQELKPFEMFLGRCSSTPRDSLEKDFTKDLSSLTSVSPVASLRDSLDDSGSRRDSDLTADSDSLRRDSRSESVPKDKSQSPCDSLDEEPSTRISESVPDSSQQPDESKRDVTSRDSLERSPTKDVVGNIAPERISFSRSVDEDKILSFSPMWSPRTSLQRTSEIVSEDSIGALNKNIGAESFTPVMLSGTNQRSVPDSSENITVTKDNVPESEFTAGKPIDKVTTSQEMSEAGPSGISNIRPALSPRDSFDGLVKSVSKKPQELSRTDSEDPASKDDFSSISSATSPRDSVSSKRESGSTISDSRLSTTDTSVIDDILGVGSNPFAKEWEDRESVSVPDSPHRTLRASLAVEEELSSSSATSPRNSVEESQTGQMLGKVPDSSKRASGDSAEISNLKSTPIESLDTGQQNRSPVLFIETQHRVSLADPNVRPSTGHRDSLEERELSSPKISQEEITESFQRYFSFLDPKLEGLRDSKISSGSGDSRKSGASDSDFDIIDFAEPELVVISDLLEERVPPDQPSHAQTLPTNEVRPDKVERTQSVLSGGFDIMYIDTSSFDDDKTPKRSTDSESSPTREVAKVMEELASVLANAEQGFDTESNIVSSRPSSLSDHSDSGKSKETESVTPKNRDSSDSLEDQLENDREVFRRIAESSMEMGLDVEASFDAMVNSLLTPRSSGFVVDDSGQPTDNVIAPAISVLGKSSTLIERRVPSVIVSDADKDLIQCQDVSRDTESKDNTVKAEEMKTVSNDIQNNVSKSNSSEIKPDNTPVTEGTNAVPIKCDSNVKASQNGDEISDMSEVKDNDSQSKAGGEVGVRESTFDIARKVQEIMRGSRCPQNKVDNLPSNDKAASKEISEAALSQPVKDLSLTIVSSTNASEEKDSERMQDSEKTESTESTKKEQDGNGKMLKKVSSSNISGVDSVECEASSVPSPFQAHEELKEDSDKTVEGTRETAGKTEQSECKENERSNKLKEEGTPIDTSAADIVAAFIQAEVSACEKERTKASLSPSTKQNSLIESSEKKKERSERKENAKKLVQNDDNLLENKESPGRFVSSTVAPLEDEHLVEGTVHKIPHESGEKKEEKGILNEKEVPSQILEKPAGEVKKSPVETPLKEQSAQTEVHKKRPKSKSKSLSQEEIAHSEVMSVTVEKNIPLPPDDDLQDEEITEKSKKKLKSLKRSTSKSSSVEEETVLDSKEISAAKSHQSSNKEDEEDRKTITKRHAGDWSKSFSLESDGAAEKVETRSASSKSEKSEIRRTRSSESASGSLTEGQEKPSEAAKCDDGEDVRVPLPSLPKDITCKTVKGSTDKMTAVGTVEQQISKSESVDRDAEALNVVNSQDTVSKTEEKVTGEKYLSKPKSVSEDRDTLIEPVVFEGKEIVQQNSDTDDPITAEKAEDSGVEDEELSFRSQKFGTKKSESMKEMKICRNEDLIVDKSNDNVDRSFSVDFGDSQPEYSGPIRREKKSRKSVKMSKSRSLSFEELDSNVISSTVKHDFLESVGEIIDSSKDVKLQEGGIEKVKSKSPSSDEESLEKTFHPETESTPESEFKEELNRSVERPRSILKSSSREKVSAESLPTGTDLSYEQCMLSFDEPYTEAICKGEVPSATDVNESVCKNFDEKKRDMSMQDSKERSVAPQSIQTPTVESEETHSSTQYSLRQHDDGKRVRRLKSKSSSREEESTLSFPDERFVTAVTELEERQFPDIFYKDTRSCRSSGRRSASKSVSFEDDVLFEVPSIETEEVQTAPVEITDGKDDLDSSFEKMVRGKVERRKSPKKKTKSRSSGERDDAGMFDSSFEVIPEHSSVSLVQDRDDSDSFDLSPSTSDVPSAPRVKMSEEDSFDVDSSSRRERRSKTKVERRKSPKKKSKAHDEETEGTSQREEKEGVADLRKADLPITESEFLDLVMEEENMTERACEITNTAVFVSDELRRGMEENEDGQNVENLDRESEKKDKIERRKSPKKKSKSKPLTDTGDASNVQQECDHSEYLSLVSQTEVPESESRTDADMPLTKIERKKSPKKKLKHKKEGEDTLLYFDPLGATVIENTLAIPKFDQLNEQEEEVIIGDTSLKDGEEKQKKIERRKSPKKKSKSKTCPPEDHWRTSGESFLPTVSEFQIDKTDKTFSNSQTAPTESQEPIQEQSLTSTSQSANQEVDTPTARSVFRDVGEDFFDMLEQKLLSIERRKKLKSECSDRDSLCVNLSSGPSLDINEEENEIIDRSFEGSSQLTKSQSSDGNSTVKNRSISLDSEDVTSAPEKDEKQRKLKSKSKSSSREGEFPSERTVFPSHSCESGDLELQIAETTLTDRRGKTRSRTKSKEDENSSMEPDRLHSIPQGWTASSMAVRDDRSLLEKDGNATLSEDVVIIRSENIVPPGNTDSSVAVNVTPTSTTLSENITPFTDVLPRMDSANSVGSHPEDPIRFSASSFTFSDDVGFLTAVPPSRPTSMESQHSTWPLSRSSSEFAYQKSTESLTSERSWRVPKVDVRTIFVGNVVSPSKTTGEGKDAAFDPFAFGSVREDEARTGKDNSVSFSTSRSSFTDTSKSLSFEDQLKTHREELRKHESKQYSAQKPPLISKYSSHSIGSTERQRLHSFEDTQNLSLLADVSHSKSPSRVGSTASETKVPSTPSLEKSVSEETQVKKHTSLAAGSSEETSNAGQIDPTIRPENIDFLQASNQDGAMPADYNAALQKMTKGDDAISAKNIDSQRTAIDTASTTPVENIDSRKRSHKGAVPIAVCVPLRWSAALPENIDLSRDPAEEKEEEEGSKEKKEGKEEKPTAPPVGVVKSEEETKAKKEEEKPALSLLNTTVTAVESAKETKGKEKEKEDKCDILPPKLKGGVVKSVEETKGKKEQASPKSMGKTDKSAEETKEKKEEKEQKHTVPATKLAGEMAKPVEETKGKKKEEEKPILPPPKSAGKLTKPAQETKEKKEEKEDIRDLPPLKSKGGVVKSTEETPEKKEEEKHTQPSLKSVGRAIKSAEVTKGKKEEQEEKLSVSSPKSTGKTSKSAEETKGKIEEKEEKHAVPSPKPTGKTSKPAEDTKGKKDEKEKHAVPSPKPTGKTSKPAEDTKGKKEEKEEAKRAAQPPKSTGDAVKSAVMSALDVAKGLLRVDLPKGRRGRSRSPRPPEAPPKEKKKEEEEQKPDGVAAALAVTSAATAPAPSPSARRRRARARRRAAAVAAGRPDDPPGIAGPLDWAAEVDAELPLEDGAAAAAAAAFADPATPTARRKRKRHRRKRARADAAPDAPAPTASPAAAAPASPAATAPTAPGRVKRLKSCEEESASDAAGPPSPDRGASPPRQERPRGPVRGHSPPLSPRRPDDDPTPWNVVRSRRQRRRRHRQSRSFEAEGFRFQDPERSVRLSSGSDGSAPPPKDVFYFAAERDRHRDRQGRSPAPRAPERNDDSRATAHATKAQPKEGSRSCK